jgi:hypothetical protein
MLIRALIALEKKANLSVFPEGVTALCATHELG